MCFSAVLHVCSVTQEDSPPAASQPTPNPQHGLDKQTERGTGRFQQETPQHQCEKVRTFSTLLLFPRAGRDPVAGRSVARSRRWNTRGVWRRPPNMQGFSPTVLRIESAYQTLASFAYKNTGPGVARRPIISSQFSVRGQALDPVYICSKKIRGIYE